MFESADTVFDRLVVLTPQERECLRLVGEHLSSKEIARELGISKASVDTYCNRARAKLGVSDRKEAARLLLRGEEAPPRRLPAEIAPVVIATPAQPAVVTLFPPLKSLGPLSRLGLIVLIAALIALGFGALITSMRSLENVLFGERVGQAATARALASER